MTVHLKSLSLEWQREGEACSLRILDQTLLPHEEKWIEVRSPEQMVSEIKRLAVRGAPLIGVAAAFSLAMARKKGARNEIAARLRDARPTAVNLMNAMDRMLAVSPDHWIAEAEAIYHEDCKLCDQIALRGAEKIRDGMRILTHCNTGGLATAGVGTALGAIRKAHEQGKKIHVYVDETRPLLQGARLTAWELRKLGIPYTLICDNMAGFLMAQNKIDLVMVGADRIAANGDFANKIGTFTVAVLAKHHGVPFYTLAPRTTDDPNCKDGSDIHIEERGADEVRAGKAPTDAPAYNPAFDVTPRSLISGILFENEER